ncbi:MAG TPA: DMT family transporter [Solirubrobacterales bacterium]|nr:DMT family transporter [Solirubrobacterales bacterium]
MSRRALILFACVSLLWGVPYLFIEIAVEGGASPLLVGWGRVAIGAAILLPIAWKLGYLRGLRRHTKALVAFAIVECGLPWWLIPLGQEQVSSSLAAILIATLPILTALIALRIDPEERVGGFRLVGLLLGITGVILLLGLDVAGRPGELLGALAILVATACYAVGVFIVKRNFSDVNPIGAVAVALAISTVMLAPAGIASIPGAEISGGAVASIAVLGSFCSALALILFFTLIAEVGPSRASVITYVNPAVAVVLGVTLLGESLGTAAVAGLLLIVAGSWISTGGGMPPGLAAIAARSRRRRGKGGEKPSAAYSSLRWTPRAATPTPSSPGFGSGSLPSGAPKQPRGD